MGWSIDSDGEWKRAVRAGGCEGRMIAQFRFRLANGAGRREVRKNQRSFQGNIFSVEELSAQRQKFAHREASAVSRAAPEAESAEIRARRAIRSSRDERRWPDR